MSSHRGEKWLAAKEAKWLAASWIARESSWPLNLNIAVALTSLPANCSPTDPTCAGHFSSFATACHDVNTATSPAKPKAAVQRWRNQQCQPLIHRSVKATSRNTWPPPTKSVARNWLHSSRSSWRMLLPMENSSKPKARALLDHSNCQLLRKRKLLRRKR